MYIAIVDDDDTARQEARLLFAETLTQLQPQLIPQLRFREYASAEDFLADFQPGTFSLLLLDIYMGALSGLDAARQVRALGETCPIFFLTTSTEHMLDGYLVFASGYFLKPLSQNREAFSQTLSHYLPQLFEKNIFTAAVDDTQLDIPFDNILYLDCNNSRGVTLHRGQDTIPIQDSYTDCACLLLQNPRFLECYYRLIVNMDKIIDMDEDVFVLVNQERIPISRRKRTQVKQEYIRYITQK